MLISLIVFLYYIVIKNKENKMDKFIGTINGVKYTDSKQFFNALQEGWKNGMVHSISYSASHTEECAEKQEPVKEPSNMNNQNEYDKFVHDFTNLFGAFVGALTGHNKPVNKCTCDRVQTQKSVEKHAPVEQAEFFSVDTIVNKYVLKKTTYQFTGTEQDDQELDKFDKYLLEKYIEFQKEDWHLTTKECLDAIHGYLTCALGEVKKGVDDTAYRLGDIDEKMAKYEKLIEIQETFGDELAQENKNTKDRYSNLTKEFDKVEAEQNYYNLLVQYYTNLLEYVDNLTPNE
jgi:tetratricopeptide (TPR) repeat protein